MSRKVHPRTVLLLSAARPSINLTFSCKVFYSSFFLCKTDPQSSNYLENRRDTLSLTAIVFVCHFENKIPLTINHGREMSTISGNAVVSLDSRENREQAIENRVEDRVLQYRKR